MTLILAATDLSPASAAVPVLAAAWARRLEAHVALLHVVHDSVLAPALAHDVAGEELQARRALERLAAAMPGVATSREVQRAESVVEAILECARSRRADWLFAGTHGRGGLQRLRLGSVAAELARRSPVPLVCVPPPGA